MSSGKQIQSEKPTSIRLSPNGQRALDELIKHLQASVPVGVKVNVSEAIENAIIEKYERIRQETSNDD